MYTMGTYMYDVFNYNTAHGTHDSLHICAAKLADEVEGTKANVREMEYTSRPFLGAKYEELVENYRTNKGNPTAFASIAENLYAQYKAELAEYEASKEV